MEGKRDRDRGRRIRAKPRHANALHTPRESRGTQPRQSISDYTGCVRSLGGSRIGARTASQYVRGRQPHLIGNPAKYPTKLSATATHTHTYTLHPTPDIASPARTVSLLLPARFLFRFRRASCLLRDARHKENFDRRRRFVRNFGEMDLKGRVALVTGAASGIGRAFAIELLRQDAKVSICDINVSEAKKLADSLSSKYGKDRVIFCQCDVTDYPQFETSFHTTIAAFGHIDIVVNNAGIMNDRFWELEVDINLNGVIRGTLLAQRFMDTSMGGSGGTVVNIGSNVSIIPYVSVPIYSATKAAIVNFTRAFGDQYHVNATGVKVMALCPGATESDLVQDVGKQLFSLRYEEAWHRDTANSVPQRAEHVAKALVSILNSAKSGTVWLVEKDQAPREISFPKH